MPQIATACSRPGKFPPFFAFFPPRSLSPVMPFLFFQVCVCLAPQFAPSPTFGRSSTYIPPPTARIPTHTPRLHSSLASPKPDTAPNVLVLFVNGGVDELMARLEETGVGESPFFPTFCPTPSFPPLCVLGLVGVGSRISCFRSWVCLSCPFASRLPCSLWAFVSGSRVFLAGGAVCLRCFGRSSRGMLLGLCFDFLGFACDVMSFCLAYSPSLAVPLPGVTYRLAFVLFPLGLHGFLTSPRFIPYSHSILSSYRS
jgi:hypothetical protein